MQRLLKVNDKTFVDLMGLAWDSQCIAQCYREGQQSNWEYTKYSRSFSSSHESVLICLMNWFCPDVILLEALEADMLLRL